MKYLASGLEILVVILLVVMAGKLGYNSGHYDGVKDTLCPEGVLVFDDTNIISCDYSINNPNMNLRMNLGGFIIDDLQT